MDDEDREAILRRRNRFMSVALAGIASLGCDDAAPQPCLSVVEPVEMRPEPDPVVMEPIGETETEEGTDPAVGDPVDMDPVADPTVVADPTMADPMPCLAPPVRNPDMRPLPRPRPCLSVRPRPRPCLTQPAMDVPIDPTLTPPEPVPRPCLSVLPERIQQKPTDSEEA